MFYLYFYFNVDSNILFGNITTNTKQRRRVIPGAMILSRNSDFKENEAVSIFFLTESEYMGHFTKYAEYKNPVNEL